MNFTVDTKLRKILKRKQNITVDTQLVIVKTILQTLYPAMNNEKKNATNITVDTKL